MLDLLLAVLVEVVVLIGFDVLEADLDEVVSVCPTLFVPETDL